MSLMCFCAFLHCIFGRLCLPETIWGLPQFLLVARQHHPAQRVVCGIVYIVCVLSGLRWIASCRCDCAVVLKQSAAGCACLNSTIGILLSHCVSCNMVKPHFLLMTTGSTGIAVSSIPSYDWCRSNWHVYTQSHGVRCGDAHWSPRALTL